MNGVEIETINLSKFFFQEESIPLKMEPKRIPLIRDSLVKCFWDWETKKKDCANIITTQCFRECNSIRILHKIQTQKHNKST